MEFSGVLSILDGNAVPVLHSSSEYPFTRGKIEQETLFFAAAQVCIEAKTWCPVTQSEGD